MYYINISGKKIGPYEGVAYPDGRVDGSIIEIIYDNAKIELSDGQKRYILGYKISKNLFGATIKYADIVDESSGETFSLQVSNIFLIKVIDGDIKILAKIGREIKLYENFGKSSKNIEPDGDKVELTPLGYFDMFVYYDDKYYYPLILNTHIERNSDIKRFYDYYGYRSYIDDFGREHLVMLIESEASSNIQEVWYYIDNFNIISPNIDFGDDSEYVEDWSISPEGIIYMEVTSGATWYLDRSKNKLIKGQPSTSKGAFSFTRVFEDTDGLYIVGENTTGYFIINRTKTNLKDSSIKNIIYFKDFKYHTRYKHMSFFVMESFDDEIVLIDEQSYLVLTTDLDRDDEIDTIVFQSDKVIEFRLKSGESRVYMVNR